MKLAITTPCLYPDTKLIHYLLESCAKQGITIVPHGIGTVFGGWAQGLISTTLPFLRDLAREGYTHVLYVDGVDVIIIASESEIWQKYLALGAPPCLMSADSECWPGYVGADEKFINPEPWRYLNAGTFIGEIDHIVGTFERLSALHPSDGNQQSWLIKEWPVPGIVLDSQCSIFQPMDGSNKVVSVGSRVLSVWTKQWPCILHFRGGYSDPVTGRDERIRPVWRQLYGEDECVWRLDGSKP